METNLFLLACSFYNVSNGESRVMKDGTIVEGFDVAMVHAQQTIDLNNTELPQLIDAVTFYNRTLTTLSWRKAYYELLSKVLKCTYSEADDSLMIYTNEHSRMAGMIEFFADDKKVTVTKSGDVLYSAIMTPDTKPVDVLNVIIKYFVEIT